MTSLLHVLQVPFAMTSWLKTLHDIAVAQQSARGFILVKHGGKYTVHRQSIRTVI